MHRHKPLLSSADEKGSYLASAELSVSKQYLPKRFTAWSKSASQIGAHASSISAKLGPRALLYGDKPAWAICIQRGANAALSQDLTYFLALCHQCLLPAQCLNLGRACAQFGLREKPILALSECLLNHSSSR